MAIQWQSGSAQIGALPTADATQEGKIFQYTGETDSNFTNGYFYECVEVLPATDPKTYEWKQKNVQDGGSGGGNANFNLDTTYDFATIQNQGQGLSFQLDDANGVTITASDPGTYINTKVLATKDYVDNNMSVIVGSNWGVAKTGTIPSIAAFVRVTVDISNLNLSNVDDYIVYVNNIQHGSIYPAATMQIVSRSATQFDIYNNSSNDGVGASYVVLAKGYGSTPSGGTTGQVLTKKSNADGDVEWADGGGGGSAFVLDTANPCSYNELQSAINAPKVILIKHEGVVYPFVEKWESDESTKRYVNIASLQRQGVDKGAMYFFFEATIGDFDSPMAYSSNFTQPTGKPYTDNIAGNLTDLTTTSKTNVVSAINELKSSVDALGEPFRVKQWGVNNLNVTIVPCTSDIGNGSLDKMTFKITGQEATDYQIVGMVAYEVFDAATNGNRLNVWPVCQFTGQNQTELSVRWMCGGTTNKVAKRINAWVLLKHR